MHLKSIKMAGFKSFVDPTTIAIRSHMNAIVGPNGCGKSNVVDAIRWVIGESSAKQLRGQSMSDVIFNGTTQRKAVGRAMVELHFDNSDARIGGEYAQYSDIVVRREVERDGQSSYFLNGTQCRRRDILGVFLGTGLGSRSYSIIEQGMISQLIEAKPEDLRHHLEEVAGISKYRERRRETENRIQHTQDNLDRLNDIREELTKQLRHLKRQANAAESYKALKAEERDYSLQIKALHWQDFEKKRLEQQQKINEENTRLEEQVAHQRDYEKQITQLTLDVEEASEQQQVIQKQYYQLGEAIARVEQQIHHHQQQLQTWKNEFEQTESLWQELDETVTENKAQVEEIENEVNALMPQKTDVNNLAIAANDALASAESAMKSWESEWETAQQQRSTLTSQLEVATTKQQYQIQQLDKLRIHQETTQEQLNHLRLSEEQEALLPLAENVAQWENRLTETERELEAQQQNIAQTRDKIKTHQQTLNQARQALQTLEKQSTQLSALQQAALGCNDEGSQAWLQQQQLTQQTRLGQQIKVKSGWEKAVETVLGGYIDAVCVDSIDAYLNSLTDLQNAHITLVEKSANTTLNAATLSQQIIGDCSAMQWLNTIYIADNFEQARDLRAKLAAHESVITPEGLWMGKNWVRISRVENAQSGVIEREQQLDELNKQIQQANQEIVTLEATQKNLEEQLAEQEEQREQTQQQYQAMRDQLASAKAELNKKRVEIDNLARDKHRLQDELTNILTESTQLEAQSQQLEEQITVLRAAQQSCNAERDTLLQAREQHQNEVARCREVAQQQKQQADEYAIRLSANENQLAVLRQAINRDEKQLLQLTEKRDVLQKNLSSDDSPLQALDVELQEKLTERLEVEQRLKAADQTLSDYKQQLKNLENQKQQTHEAVDQLKTKIDELRLSTQEFSVRQQTVIEQLQEAQAELQAVLENLPAEANLKNWQEQLDTLARRIQRLGPINLAAIDEYQVSEERKTHLDHQFADLTEALDTLQGAIRKIDRESKTRFKETFDKVNSGFQTIFPQVFGGGRAALELSEDDMLTAGVFVKAQPPGKRNTSIHMLSGGEKALTAISLIFAMFQLNPAPFCILDEVDAPLDDLNVSRFCRLVKDMSNQTQFLVISHNKNTIEKADHLLGVTMQEPGVSRLVAVDMQEALDMVEA